MNCISSTLVSHKNSISGTDPVFLTAYRYQELHPNFAVFPTYSIILRELLAEFHPFYQMQLLTISSAFKLTDEEVTDFYARQKSNPIPGVSQFDARRVVDGQRKLTLFKPLPTTSAGKKFELRNKVVGVYDKGKPGTVLETEQSIVDKETGEVYSKTATSSFFVGQGNWGGPKGEYKFPRLFFAESLSNLCAFFLGPSTVNFPPPEGKKPDAVYVVQSTKESAHLYR